jgi:hypothetical protein
MQNNGLLQHRNPTKIYFTIFRDLHNFLQVLRFEKPNQHSRSVQAGPTRAAGRWGPGTRQPLTGSRPTPGLDCGQRAATAHHARGHGRADAGPAAADGGAPGKGEQGAGHACMGMEVRQRGSPTAWMGGESQPRDSARRGTTAASGGREDRVRAKIGRGREGEGVAARN